MATCVPVSDLKDTTSFSEKVALAGEPVIVTKNGYEKFVVIDSELFRQYRRITPEEHLEDLLKQSDLDIAAGRTSDVKEGLANMRARYGL